MLAAALALLAGLLSTLSPCVLPLLPVVLGAAAAQHRAGPLALASGVALSFTVIGLFVATVGFAIGLDGAVLRKASAVLLAGFGLALIWQPAAEAVARVFEPVGRVINLGGGQGEGRGLTGQFMLGLLLGAAWSPCVGPTLGAASVLASEGKDLPSVALTMSLFGIGAALPLLLLGLVSREAILASRGRLMAVGAGGKHALGILLLVVAGLIITGLDKLLEAHLVAAAPDWLVELTTRY